MFDHRVVGEVFQDLSAAVFREVVCDEKKMQPAFAAAQSVATHDQHPRTQGKGKQSLDGFGGNFITHVELQQTRQRAMPQAKRDAEP